MKNFNSFCITGGKGFRLTFANGWGVSVQWGPGNYASHDGSKYDFDAPKRTESWQAGTAEVAVFTPAGEFLTGITPHDDVAGHVSAEQVARLLSLVAAFYEKKSLLGARTAVRGVLGVEDEFA